MNSANIVPSAWLNQGVTPIVAASAERVAEVPDVGM